jgi:hypothetical protein
MRSILFTGKEGIRRITLCYRIKKQIGTKAWSGKSNGKSGIPFSALEKGQGEGGDFSKKCRHPPFSKNETDYCETLLIKGGAMKNPIKILHIYPDYKVTYFIIRDGGFIKSSVSLEAAVTLLKNEEFDLIISEPHKRAILNPQASPKNIAPVLEHLGDHPSRQTGHDSSLC